MADLLTGLGWAQVLLLGIVLGAVLCSALGVAWHRRLQLALSAERRRLERSLRHAQVQLDQTRKNAEALEIEVLEWRRRSHLRSPRASGSSRFASSTPPAEPEAWVIGALLDGDGDRASGFADTQILPGAAH